MRDAQTMQQGASWFKSCGVRKQTWCMPSKRRVLSLMQTRTPYGDPFPAFGELFFPWTFFLPTRIRNNNLFEMWTIFVLLEILLDVGQIQSVKLAYQDTNSLTLKVLNWHNKNKQTVMLMNHNPGHTKTRGSLVHVKSLPHTSHTSHTSLPTCEISHNWTHHFPRRQTWWRHQTKQK